MSEDLYQAAIVAAARAGKAHGRLEAPNGSATVDNPLCGDRVTIDVALAGEVVEAVGQLVRGCLLCEAAGALIADAAPGQAPAALREVRPALAAMLEHDAPPPGGAWRELECFVPVRPYKSRHECVLLAFEALEKALEAAAR